MFLLNFRTAQSNAFKCLIESLKEFLIDVNIKFNKDGMKIMTMDESHSTLVDVTLDADKFDQYECSSKTVYAGVKVNDLSKLMKSISQDDVLTWYILENNEDILGIRIETSKKKQVTEYHYRLMDLNVDELDIPVMNFPFIITLPSNDLQKICRDMKNLNPKDIDMKFHKDQLILSASGDFASQTTTRSSEEKDGKMTIKQTSDMEIFQARLDLERIIEITKCMCLGGSMCVEISLMNNYPVAFRAPVADLGEIRIFLAPKVEEQT